MATTYQINGVDFPTIPSEGSWGQRKQLGVDGFNRAIYEPTYNFQISFDALTQEEYIELYNFWLLMSSNITVSVTIPQKDATTYDFATYTGCVIDEPAVGPYYQGYQMSVKIVIRSIRI